MTDHCVSCNSSFDQAGRTFEQRLVDDDSFCSKCWTEIMDAEYDSDVAYLDGIST